jgi:hypothetical protein
MTTGEHMTDQTNVPTDLVAFGGWRCGCTMLAISREEIADKCPAHGDGLLGPVEWVSNKNDVRLGLKGDGHYPECGVSEGTHEGPCDCNADLAECAEHCTTFPMGEECLKCIDVYDPTPWCAGCGAMKRKDCDCGPIAENN